MQTVDLVSKKSRSMILGTPRYNKNLLRASELSFVDNTDGTIDGSKL